MLVRATAGETVDAVSDAFAPADLSRSRRAGLGSFVVPVAALCALVSCSNASPGLRSDEPLVSLPPPVVPAEQMSAVGGAADSPAMVALRAAGTQADERIRVHAENEGVSPSSLSAETLEAIVATIEPVGDVVFTVVRGRVQVSVGAESVCLLLAGSPERPAFLEERSCR